MCFAALPKQGERRTAVYSNENGQGEKERRRGKNTNVCFVCFCLFTRALS
jgi:hypothetical protein